MKKDKKNVTKSTEPVQINLSTEQAIKVNELKNKLLISGAATIIKKALGEMYERETGKTWM